MKQFALIMVFLIIGTLFLSGLFLIFYQSSHTNVNENKDTLVYLAYIHKNSSFANNEEYQAALGTVDYLHNTLKKDPYNSSLWIRLYGLNKAINDYEGQSENSKTMMALTIARKLRPDLKIQQDLSDMIIETKDAKDVSNE